LFSQDVVKHDLKINFACGIAKETIDKIPLWAFNPDIKVVMQGQIKDRAYSMNPQPITNTL